MTKHSAFTGSFLIILMFNIAYCSESSQPADNGIVTIGIYADSGAAVACVTAASNMFQWMGHEVFLMDADFINNKDLEHIDIFYFPGGSPIPYTRNITYEGRKKIRKMIEKGCGYIGTCAGGIYAAEFQTWHGETYSAGQLGIFPGTAAGPIPQIYELPEIGMCQVNLNKFHQITGAEPDSLWIMYYNGPYFTPSNASRVDTIGTYEITGKVALVACEYGKGRVFLTGPHPEWEEDDDRDSISYFDSHDDLGSDWTLMHSAVQWCLHED
ncbi:MAG: BPL-N domain-containing protein [candidate division WOR-3 bacterium]|nr:BPL-N domain-containing protein [candidate division WOR-3 bacterium]